MKIQHPKKSLINLGYPRSRHKITQQQSYSTNWSDFFLLIFLYFYDSRPNTNRRSSSQSDVYKCRLCRSYHALRFCRKFLAMDSLERNKVVRKYEYCINCLAKSHTFRKCQSKNTCNRCQHYHHTLLHQSTRPRITPPNRQRQELQPYRKAAKQQKKPSTKATTKRKAAPRTSSKKPSPLQTEPHPVPNQLILSEAIKSLATVLCATHAPA